jgi:hypothetical protein
MLRVTDSAAPDAPAGATAPPTVRATAGAVEVLGLLDVPDPCHTVRAEPSRGDGRITLALVARASEDPCVAMLATLAYAATVRDVPAGSYALTVTHRYEGSGWPASTVLQTTVAVP